MTTYTAKGEEQRQIGRSLNHKYSRLWPPTAKILLSTDNNGKRPPEFSSVHCSAVIFSSLFSPFYSLVLDCNEQVETICSFAQCIALLCVGILKL
jgi:hypothetical protein